jgi:DNA-formamidopyrimidine glycosylase
MYIYKMPELCEVVFTAQLLSSKLVGKTLDKISVLSGRYSHQHLKGIDLIKKYAPLTINKVDSKGKFLWFTLESQNDNTILYIMCTLGQTGEFSFNKNKSTRVHFDIINKSKQIDLYYNDQRNFGTISITSSLGVLDKKLNSLSRDLLKSTYTLKDFTASINKYKSKSDARYNHPIVKVLMDQSTNSLGSGIGNYLSSSVLYRAKISPYRSIGSLSKTEIKKLYNSIKYVLKLCYLTNTIGYMENFKDYIDEYKAKIKSGQYPNYLPEIDIKKDIFQFDVYRKHKDLKGNNVEIAKIIKGRSTYWVPAVQK